MWQESRETDYEREGERERKFTAEKPTKRGALKESLSVIHEHAGTPSAVDMRILRRLGYIKLKRFSERSLKC
jgi:hypothetical protein